MVDISEVPLIPRRILFGNPDRAMARLSPDGQQLAYLAPVDGVLNVWAGPTGTPAEMKPVTNDTGRGIRLYAWAYTNRHILYLQDKGGDEDWQLYSVALDSVQVQNLTPLEGVQAQIVAISPDSPYEIIVGLNDRNAQLHDLYRINIKTGERQLIQQNDGYMSFVVDEAYQVRFASRMRRDGGYDILKVTDEGEWPLFLEVLGEDLLTTDVVGFNHAGDTLYMTASSGRDTAALYAVDPETGERQLLAEDPRADVGEVLVDPIRKHIQAVSFNYQRKEWHLLDESIEKELAFLRTVADGDVEIASRTLDDQTWLAAYLMDDGPVRYYRFDRQEMAAEFLFTDRPALEDQPLAKMHPAVIRSRDGLDLVSYYTLPPGSDSDGDGRPDQPLPMALFVHGGPWGRDEWGYHPYYQWLANRGYAVLGINFRGSTGFGKAFVNAGDLEWGAAMHDDLLDGVAWAVEQGIADPDRVAISGGSYGGYATLAGMTFSPEAFACGVDIVGPSNLITLLESIPPYWQPMVELFTTRVGDFRTEEGQALLRQRSPLTYVDRIRRPLLIGQGANDPRVNQAESDQIVGAMQENEIPVTYVLYPDEGHGFARPENNMSFSAVAEAFLAPILGGRYEPIGQDFEGSSITVPVGADEVPGLAEALAAGPGGR
jgi:dipeptidyl aminopeptidase/acylaminoacyl peptidase